MDFGQALILLKEGRKVRRAGWTRETAFVKMTPDGMDLAIDPGDGKHYDDAGMGLSAFALLQEDWVEHE